jgi:hypothetical protein
VTVDVLSPSTFRRQGQRGPSVRFPILPVRARRSWPELAGVTAAGLDIAKGSGGIIVIGNPRPYGTPRGPAGGG